MLLRLSPLITVKYSLISEAVLGKNLIVAQPSKRWQLTEDSLNEEKKHKKQPVLA